MHTISFNNTDITPSKVVCIGRNYVEHIKELGNEVPDDMVVFVKPNSAISSKLISTHQEPLHYEGELCFMVKNGQFAAVGFGLDLTKRDLQSKLKSKGLPWERAKGFNGAAVLSQFVELPGDIKDLSFKLSINGTLTQAGDPALMMYKPDNILTELASFMQLEDGDIVMTGTPKGVGVINHGDVFVSSVKYKDETIIVAQWIAE